ncbi:eggshell protein 1-like [Oryza brachyantha]|uniref:eggshell protein 1-like n=1 Tax=Oryza brachyantha TaxID=4533 RepID=UPI001ADBA0C2|nr:eggshell protein 1-like [Oryza brachyantha]
MAERGKGDAGGGGGGDSGDNGGSGDCSGGGNEQRGDDDYWHKMVGPDDIPIWVEDIVEVADADGNVNGNGGDGPGADRNGADGDGNVVAGPEDEPIGVNEGHLYGVVDLESQKEGTGRILHLL